MSEIGIKKKKVGERKDLKLCNVTFNIWIRTLEKS